jgi:hypothetical protein
VQVPRHTVRPASTISSINFSGNAGLIMCFCFYRHKHRRIYSVKASRKQLKAPRTVCGIARYTNFIGLDWTETSKYRVNWGNLAHGTNRRTLFLTSLEPKSHSAFKLIDWDLGQVYTFEWGKQFWHFFRLW